MMRFAPKAFATARHSKPTGPKNNVYKHQYILIRRIRMEFTCAENRHSMIRSDFANVSQGVYRH